MDGELAASVLVMFASGFVKRRNSQNQHGTSLVAPNPESADHGALAAPRQNQCNGVVRVGYWQTAQLWNLCLANFFWRGDPSIIPRTPATSHKSGRHMPLSRLALSVFLVAGISAKYLLAAPLTVAASSHTLPHYAPTPSAPRAGSLPGMSYESHPSASGYTSQNSEKSSALCTMIYCTDAPELIASLHPPVRKPCSVMRLANSSGRPTTARTHLLIVDWKVSSDARDVIGSPSVEG